MSNVCSSADFEVLQEEEVDEDDKCAICLELMGMNEVELVHLPCAHKFHLPCIRTWAWVS